MHEARDVSQLGRLKTYVNEAKESVWTSKTEKRLLLVIITMTTTTTNVTIITMTTMKNKKLVTGF